MFISRAGRIPGAEQQRCVQREFLKIAEKLYLQRFCASHPTAAAAVATSQTRMTLININSSFNLDEIMFIMM